MKYIIGQLPMFCLLEVPGFWLAEESLKGGNIYLLVLNTPQIRRFVCPFHPLLPNHHALLKLNNHHIISIFPYFPHEKYLQPGGQLET
jgi:hypothetical protein